MSESEKVTRAGTYERWAVLVRRKDGSAFLASGNQCTVAYFRDRDDALQWADELAEHIGPRKRMKVVKVQVTIEVMT